MKATDDSGVSLQDDTERSNCCSRRVIGITLVLFGVIFIVLGILSGTYFPSMVNRSLIGRAIMCDESDISHDSFLHPYNDCDDCVPYYYSYHPFHVINPMDVLLNPNSTKLKLQEKGPYTYRRYLERFDATLTDDNMVKFKFFDKWVFQPSLSCEECKPTDIITQMDGVYNAAATRKAGERNLVLELVSVVLPKYNIDATVIEAVKENTGMLRNFLRVLNGLNSMHAPSMLKAVATLGPVLQLGGASSEKQLEGFKAFEQVPLDGMHFSGIFTNRTVEAMAMGTPSFTLGISATVDLTKCESGKFQFCEACDFSKPSSACLQSRAQCDKCSKAIKAKMLTVLYLCDKLENLASSQIGKQNANILVELTCRQCNKTGNFCLAPGPGPVVGKSGIDYKEVDVEMFKTTFPFTTRNTGCGNIQDISNYGMYNGVKTNPIWSRNHTNSSMNPTAPEVVLFRENESCDPDEKNDAVVCSPVQGKGTSGYPPAGASVKGFNSKLSFTSVDIYNSESKQKVTLFDTGTSSHVKGIRLQHFRPDTKYFDKTTGNEDTGIGVPVNGVQNLGYPKGILMFFSPPFFMHGDTSLLDAIELYFSDGKSVTKTSMYNTDGDGSMMVKSDVDDKFSSYLNIEPATGRPFDFRKRQMSSYAFARLSDGKSISNLNYPDIKPDIIVPAYWIEARATITSSLADKFKSNKKLAALSLPFLISGLIFGMTLVAVGSFFIVKYQREHSGSNQKTVMSSSV
eukprot:CAMPEP_0197834824 /NCGR_PEP_ID=MMETSP1437-20131217/23832_1 /TAXON_ID=49252 ORGANISM="Eucampia antarctica, Strain CCMP1452" /NCGR_SAMPLE_ID=MMETSP1437 /ASSEMBLY_ACC=CAM_ASM_001096 /LENGTH=740 /DNA_ID=CAMNT_0043439817 /DNA_START=14 /DNA_END=2236 /DNA_ORIENTATION=+